MDFMATGFCLKAFQPSRGDSFRFAGNPALKRRAISGLSLAGQNNCAQKFNKDFVLFDSLRKIGGVGAGTAVISPYDKDRKNPAAAYCFKREFDQYGKERERYDDMSENLVKYLRNKTVK
jgi:hypothetical protein